MSAMSPAPNHHLKAEAARLVDLARREGRLGKPAACESCGETKGYLVHHHYDYAEPLDVIPLCGSCHQQVHRGTLAEPRTGRMYPKPPKQRPKSREQVNVRLSPDQLAAIDATGATRSIWLRRAADERLERDAGRNPARVAMAPLVWQLIELALFHNLITPVELLIEARKYNDEP